MNNFKEVEIGNSRLIFRKTEISDSDVVSILKEVDDFIEKNPKLSRASDPSFIYFLDNKSEEALIGKEVIGFCSDDFLADFDLSSMDLASSTIYSYTYDGDLEISSVLEQEKKIRQTASFLPMWRVNVSGTMSQLIQLEFWKI